jgi:Ulp1 family protease
MSFHCFFVYSHDCGFHMLMHAEHWDGRTVCNFNEKDMPSIRKLLTCKWFTPRE